MVKPKKEYATIGFRIYLFKRGNIGADIKGRLVSLGTGDKEIGHEMFNHWDDIQSGMRKLLKDAGYTKKWNEKIDLWEFEKK